VKKADIAIWSAVFVLAVALRLALFFIYRPDGLEPDGLGMTLLFWGQGELSSRLPGWWGSLMPKVAGYWPPVYPWLVSVFGKLTGDPFLGARLLNALAAGGLAVLAGRIVRLLTASRRAAWMAGLLAATAPLAVAWDVRVRPEGLWSLVGLAGLYFLVRYLSGRRLGNDLIFATALFGLSACVKFEAILIVPPLLWLWSGRLRREKWKDLPVGLVALGPWVLAAVWMLTHELARSGDYAELLSLQTLRQLPVWFALSLAALAEVLGWPVAALALVGLFVLYRDRPRRPLFRLFVYLVAVNLAAVAVGYNWLSRYLLLVLPFLLIIAAVGWAGLPNLLWLRWGAAALSLVASFFLAHQWVAAEKDQWRETIEAGQALREKTPPTAVVWSDDPYLLPYWAGRDVRTLDKLTDVRPGEVVVLSDFYGALRHKRTVNDSREALEKAGRLEILAETVSVYTPLSGSGVDPFILAQAANLRELGPAIFWHRRIPIANRVVVARYTSR